MSTLANDTSPEAEQVQIRIWRAMPPWRKLELVAEMNAAVRALALAGLARRYPGATPAELERRLIRARLGEELATHVYGPLDEQTE